ncbi:MAG: hypothetical protein K2W96_04425, partial [Gemmataceae bacterium]|nr:hypothetical protein [Gemmataceae bacterium]
MPFVTRAAIALLAGIGAGAVGFAAAWHGVHALGEDPGIGWNVLLVPSIFVPSALVPLAVFRAVSVGRGLPQYRSEPPMSMQTYESAIMAAATAC